MAMKERSGVQWMLNLTTGLAAGDLLTILDWSKYEHTVQCYDPRSQTMHPASVPWPMKWLVLRRHRKHISLSRALPSMHTFRQQVFNFGNKLRWRWYFQFFPQPASTFRGPRAVTTPTFSKEREANTRPEWITLDWWIKAVTKRLITTATRARQRAKHSSRLYANMGPLEKMAIRLYRQGECAAVPNDKDQSFSLILKVHRALMSESVLNARRYMIVNRHGVTNSLVKTYRDICRWVGQRMDDDSLGTTMFRSALFPRATVFSRLQLLVKAQKPPGEVVPRPVHASQNYMFAGLSCWLAQILRTKLQGIAPWLLKDSKDLMARIRNIPRQDITRWHMATIDVKDFYLNGSAEAITEAVVSLWPDHDPMRTTLRRVLLFVLDSQFVDDPWELSDNITYQVTEGSGMGLLHSGEVADCALVALMELPITSSLGPAGVKGYVRFRDDILILSASKVPATKQLFTRMQQLASFYPLKIEFGWWRIDFLELEISKSGDHFSVSHLLKPSSLSPPLAPSSAHPRHVHSSWPQAYACRIRQLCSTRDLFQLSISRVVDRLRANFASEYTTGMLQQAARRYDNGRGRQTSLRQERDCFSWLVGLPSYDGAGHM